ncbi:molybdopterin-dependent oxidoreductase [Nocardioides sp. ChNu-153]|uniref:molybdopterin-dependent oxidoreductase n=1 Tax=Nocardioides sp. ChNu-153 TaxID=2779364 RepID=UPI002651A6A0|nr:molybdopterin-dependent oxidoreductase [Nocardioides sp. ChNu-153]MDN7121073.1 molybdopterin-dependent oxidoreductase [Nocardioides sp. ChNu-153]
MATSASGTTHRSPAAGGRARTAIAALGGVLATLVGMAVGHLVAALLDPSASPVLAVGSTVIDLTPTPVKEWAVANFGNADKPILIGSVLLVTLLLAAVAGIIAARRFVVGLALLLVLVGVAGVLALVRPTASVVDVVPALATALTGAAALWWFHRTALGVGPGTTTAADAPREATTQDTEGAGATDHPTGPRPTRRGVLVAGGVLAVTAAAAGAVGQWIGSVKTRIGNIVLPTAVDSDPDLPDGLDIDGLSKFRTPNDEFYRVDVNLTVPVVDQDDWTLTIDGDVENELTITWDELLDMDMVERDITMTCVSNDVGGQYVGAARWLGVPLTDLLDRAGVGDRADQLLSTAVDGFTISTPLDVATDGRDALVVVGMNGEPLPREHGFPVRLVIPGIYGYVGSTKWLTKLTLTTYDEEVAYWTERGWATEAPVKISSRVDVPKAAEEMEPGKVVIAGVAWAQTRGIAKVEVQIDGGGWTEATLGADAGVDYWRQWYYEWDATESGRHTVTVRATDVDGEVQTDARMAPFPEGSSGLHTRAIQVA